MKGLLIALVLLFPTLMFAQDTLPYPCGVKTKFEVKTERSQPLPPVPSGKAMVMVVREASAYFNIGVAINGKWIGATRKDEANYFYLFLEPGEYKMCASGGLGRSQLSPAFLTIKVEADKTYYVEADYIADWKQGRARLQLADSEQGSQIVKRGYIAKLR